MVKAEDINIEELRPDAYDIYRDNEGYAKDEMTCLYDERMEQVTTERPEVKEILEKAQSVEDAEDKLRQLLWNYAATGSGINTEGSLGDKLKATRHISDMAQSLEEAFSHFYDEDKGENDVKEYFEGVKEAYEDLVKAFGEE